MILIDCLALLVPFYGQIVRSKELSGGGSGFGLIASARER
jgi:hypothetical protein